MGILTRLILLIYFAIFGIGALLELSWIGYGAWNTFQPISMISLLVFFIVLGVIFGVTWACIGVVRVLEWLLLGEAPAWQTLFRRS